MEECRQALSAVLGGTQYLHTNSRDEALSLPTEDSVRTALRTQQVIAYESGVPNTIDPLAGSFYIEELTDRIEQEADALMKELEKAGGVVACIEQGIIQRKIEDSAYEYQKEIEKGERIIVGVNRFQVEEEIRPPLLRVDPAIEQAQVKNLAQLRKERNNDKVTASLDHLRAAAQGDENLMPVILEAVKEYATLGEICNILRGIFGVYKERG